MSTVRAHLRSRSQKGFAIVAAIFLLVILAALGAFMLTMSSTQQITSTQDMQATRAYWAAKAGIQWAASTINTTPGCAAATLALDGFSVAVTCTTHDYVEGPDTRKIYWVVSTATAVGPSVGDIAYVEREVSAVIEF